MTSAGMTSAPRFPPPAVPSESGARGSLPFQKWLKGEQKQQQQQQQQQQQPLLLALALLWLRLPQPPSVVPAAQLPQPPQPLPPPQLLSPQLVLRTASWHSTLHSFARSS